MKKQLKKWSGRTLVYAGLSAALVLGIIGSFYCVVKHHSVPPAVVPEQQQKKVDIEKLDAKAKPHFKAAEQNIHSVVKKITKSKNLWKLSWYMAQDKISGTDKARHFLNSYLDDAIIAPCRAGARVYGCDFDSDGFLKMMRDVNADYAATKAYAIGSLSIEALFLRKTIASFYTILGSVIGRFAASCGSGTALAAADGPLPFGDLVGVALAAGGTAWSVYDINKASKQLPSELEAMLKQAVHDCQAACRMEVLK